MIKDVALSANHGLAQILASSTFTVVLKIWVVHVCTSGYALDSDRVQIQV